MYITMRQSILSAIAMMWYSIVPASAQTYTLSQLTDSAQATNISIRNARHDIESASEQRKEAFTNYFPNVSATGLWFNANKGMAETTVNPSEVLPQSLGATLASSLPPEALADLANPINVSMMKHGTIASITAVQPVFAGGQIVNGNKLARVGEDVSLLQLQLSENEVEKTTSQYFWQAVILQEKMKTVAAAEKLLSGLNNDVAVAVKAGVTNRNDLLQVQLRQNEIESQKLKLTNGLSVIKLLLAQHCGLRDTSFGLAYTMEAMPALPLKHNHREALASTAEYRLLDKQVEAAELQHRLAVGKNLPNVAIGAGYNYHNMLGNDHTFAMVFATVSIPISAWWGGSHAMKRQKIQLDKAQQQLSDNSEKLIIRMQKAWNDVEEAHHQLAIAQRSIEQAGENLRLNIDYYHAGTSTMSDLLQAQMLHQQALDSRVDAWADYQMKLLEYQQAVGY